MLKLRKQTRRHWAIKWTLPFSDNIAVSFITIDMLCLSLLREGLHCYDLTWFLFLLSTTTIATGTVSVSGRAAPAHNSMVFIRPFWSVGKEAGFSFTHLFGGSLIRQQWVVSYLVCLPQATSGPNALIARRQPCEGSYNWKAIVEDKREYRSRRWYELACRVMGRNPLLLYSWFCKRSPLHSRWILSCHWNPS